MDLWGSVQELSATDWIVTVVFCYFIYRVVLAPRFKKRNEPPPPEPELPPMKKQDMTVKQLLEYDGLDGKNDGRILIACDGKIFDVTRGKRNYGPEGPYAALAGHDASRGLATFQLGGEAVRDEYDDLSDLGPSEIEDMKNWAETFTQRYPVVGKLLKPGDTPADYGDELAILT
uniref:Cytochrome b5 heme-binding domain-containing protein n=1 Tax=Plectus sambesii TaxID=2011161 RepID=A0A914V8D5_9BILA